MIFYNSLDVLQVKLLISEEINNKTAWYAKDMICDFHKIYFPTDSEFILSDNTGAYTVTKGQIAIIPAGLNHSYNPKSDKGFSKLYCHFLADIANDSFFKAIGADEKITVLNIPTESVYNDIKKVFSELVEGYQSYLSNNSISTILYNKSKVTELLSLIMDIMKPKTVSSNINKFEDSISYMNKNLSKQVTLQELADDMHFHPAYYCRIFKQYFGISPMKYMNNLRIEKAKQLLSLTNLTLEDICEQIGMNNTFYFSSLFKKATGMSPTAFRKTYSTLM